MKAYKLTDEHGRTRGGFQWSEGITHSATGSNKELCSDGWIHFYIDPLIAVLLNPVHANFKNPILWECETSGEELHEPLKSGCKTLTIVRKITLPEFSIEQLAVFSILCAKQVYKVPYWNVWAENWLNGTDRTGAAAWSAARVAASAATSAASAAVSAAYAAAYAAAAASAAARAAASAAGTAASAAKTIDFSSLARQSLTYK